MAKIINPENKGGYITEDWCGEQFTPVADLREKLFAKYLVNTEFQIGYLSPGHGMKGKQYPLTTDGELKTMYTEYFGRKCVTLWLKTYAQVKEKKRVRGDYGPMDDAQPPAAKRSARYETQMKRMEVILDKLKEKHSEGSYTPEQLHCWANLIQMKKHTSYDSPPEYRYFKSKSSGEKSGVTAASPGKRIQQRSECIDQLTKLHTLMENGIVTAKQYEEMHKKIKAKLLTINT